MSKYLIRLDDACPTMDRQKWQRIEELFDQYSIKPMVGIVPHCEDNKLKINQEDENFWVKARAWRDKGWAIALHGYNHCYISNQPGINPMWNRSEFAGLDIQVQKEKIRKGVEILRGHELTADYFFAPSHTFDENTLKALKEESTIRIISDTIGRYPYKRTGFWYIPQISGHCVKMPINGIYTFCFHPNTMSDISFNRLEAFLKDNREDFISFDAINLSLYGKKRLFDRFLSWTFFTYRKIRNVK